MCLLKILLMEAWVIGDIIMQQEEEKEREDIFSMYKMTVNYDDLVDNVSSVIEYLMKKSDCFSVTVIIKKPYSQQPPVFNQSEQFNDFIIKYYFDYKTWPVNFLGRLKHQILIMCCCNKESREMLLKIPNIFIPEINMPEDICFYRNGKLWFATVSHEKLAFVFDAKKEDLKFFLKNGIAVHDC